MKPKHIVLIVFLILNIAGCNSIQPKPDGYGWDRCTKCEGYGYIIHQPASDKSRIKESEEREKYNEAVLFFNDDPKIIEKAENDSQTYNSGDSGIKKNKITCRRCNGRGWIKNR